MVKGKRKHERPPKRHRRNIVGITHIATRAAAEVAGSKAMTRLLDRKKR